MYVSPELIAKAIVILVGNGDIADFFKDLLSSSRRTSNIWQELSATILNECSSKTVNSHVSKIFHMVQRNTDDIYERVVKYSKLRNINTCSSTANRDDGFSVGCIDSDTLSHVESESISSDKISPNEYVPSNEPLTPGESHCQSEIDDTFMTESVETKDGTINTPTDIDANGNLSLGCITLPKEFFEKYFTDGKTSFSTGWTNAFNDQFEKINNKCVLQFVRHRIQYGGRKRKFTPFKGKAHCKMQGCCQYEFTIYEPIVKTKNSTVHVYQIGSYNHSANEIHRRFYSGERRDKLREKLSQTHACILTGEMISNVPEDILQSGNRNNAPSMMILNKIASEGRTSFDLDESFHLFLTKLRKEFLSDDKWDGKIVKGFIQGYTVYPSFSVTLFSERQIRLIIDLMKCGYLCLHLDATGSIFAQPPDSEKRPFYYCLVISGENNTVPIAPLEFITCGHDVYNIEKCLALFVFAMKRLTIHRPLVSQIETDFSKALLQAACKSFNNMDISFYMECIWERIMEDNLKDFPLTIIHVCSSHVIKAAIKRIKSFTNEKDLQNLLRSCVGLLIHKTDLKDAVCLFKIICHLFGRPTKSELHESYLKKFADLQSMDCLESTDTEVIEEDEDYNWHGTSERQKSKFFILFKREYQEILELPVYDEVPNNLYVPKFMAYMIDELLPYYPLWSAIAIQCFGLRRNSNAAVESWHKTIKHYLFDGRMRQLIPRAIRTLANNAHNRLVQRKFDCTTTRQSRNRIMKKQSIQSDLNDCSTDTENSSGSTIENRKRCAIANDDNVLSRRKRSKVPNVSKEMENDTNEENSELEMDHDLNTETWCKNGTLTPYNWSFSNFPKKVSQWEDNKLSHKPVVSVQEKKLTTSQATTGTTVPWDELHVECYPENWRTLSFYIGNMLINEDSLKTLLPNEELDDNIINTFLKICESESMSTNKILLFDAHFFVTLLDNSKRFGFVRWAQKVAAWKYNIWVLPKCENSHWTLMIIVFPSNAIIYLDSLHGTVKKEVLRRLCGFIEKVRSRKQNLPPIQWKDWTLFCPKDTPSQLTSTGPGVNCGVHVCLWGLIVFSSELLIFQEHDMLRIRRWIFYKLVRSQNSYKERTKSVYNISEIDPMKHESKDSDFIKRSFKPPSGSISTLEYVAFLKHLF